MHTGYRGLPRAVLHLWCRYYNIYALRHKWAFRWTSASFTQGASSTARGEGTFGAVKGFISGGCALIELYEQLDTLTDQKRASNIMQVTRAVLNSAGAIAVSPLIRSLQAKGCSPFIQQVAAAQFARAAEYAHVRVQSPSGWGDDSWSVWHHSGSAAPAFSQFEMYFLF